MKYRHLSYLNVSPWKAIPFVPIVYTFMWGGRLRVFWTNEKPIRFEDLGPYVYDMWLTIGFICPPLVFMSWIMVTRCYGKCIVLGMWLRFGSDTALFSSLLAFHLSDTVVYRVTDETHIYTRYLIASILFFLLLNIIRDIWIIRQTNCVAKRLRQ